MKSDAVNMASKFGVILAVDLSMAKTGLAWGLPGERPVGWSTIKGQKQGSEGARILTMAGTITMTAQRLQVNTVVFGEFYRAVNDLSFRASCGLRGALLADLAGHGIQALGIHETKARKGAGVDVRKKQDGEKKGYMKKRVKSFLTAYGLGKLQEDEGDAAVLLMGARYALPEIFKGEA